MATEWRTVRCPMLEVVHRWPPAGGSTVAEPWPSTNDFAARLGVIRNTIYQIAEKGMAAHEVGQLCKFQASEVGAWALSGSAAPGSSQGEVE
ncbi:hypothetical protein ACFPOI_51330 [Nonomuraea angiospora]|uniref:Excisionase family DNA binding protein n=1 Tax=Nonomuraea angiospora TaxID=46172 RepID=A0ABR9M1H7_9ACTN|nr:hypothetical protein [Nonomuraea angiospora]MBE1586758.1 excisionase family DNA binding protein [Nonomuraea angiospora]